MASSTTNKNNSALQIAIGSLQTIADQATRTVQALQSSPSSPRLSPLIANPKLPPTPPTPPKPPPKSPALPPIGTLVRQLESSYLTLSGARPKFAAWVAQLTVAAKASPEPPLERPLVDPVDVLKAIIELVVLGETIEIVLTAWAIEKVIEVVVDQVQGSDPEGFQQIEEEDGGDDDDEDGDEDGDGDGDGDGGGGCFAPDTLVLMANRQTRAINEIAVGDEVLTITEASHLSDGCPAVTTAVVQAVHRHDGPRAVFDVGGVLTTGNHPWAARLGGQAGFLTTVELTAGAELRVCAGDGEEYVRAPCVEPVPARAQSVFNLKTTARTFAVAPSSGGPFYLVHNKENQDPDPENIVTDVRRATAALDPVIPILKPLPPTGAAVAAYAGSTLDAVSAAISAFSNGAPSLPVGPPTGAPAPQAVPPTAAGVAAYAAQELAAAKATILAYATVPIFPLGPPKPTPPRA